MLPDLFSSVQVGNMEVKNRLLMSAMSINFGVDENGHVTDQLIEYFVARAKGGVGMILVGGGSVHPGGQELPDLPQMYDDSCIPSLKEMVQRVKAYETCFGVQLMHGGRQSYLPEKVAPSAIPAPAVVKGEVRALEIPEIKDLVDCFGESARRCREAGFDLVELHGGHGYLINQFLAPNSNIRTDEYGGNFGNRTRFLMEVLASVREKAGVDFPVGIRINGNDYIENGWTIEDAVRLAPALEAAGAVYLHISGGVYGSTELTIPSMYTPQGCFIHLAEAVKKVVDIPVVTVGRIKDPVQADGVIREGKADMVALGRSLLADPEYPNKAKAGRISNIRPCVGCCLGCIHAVLAKEPGSCVVNPDVGREYKLARDGAGPGSENVSGATPDRVPGKILVAGAGPAGMAAARMFALEGHTVMLCEQGPVPGGLLVLASHAPGRGELGDILRFFNEELGRLGVEIRFNTPLSREIMDEFKPAQVVLATGSMPDMPVIKGLFKTKMDLLTNVDVLTDGVNGARRAIVIGGGMTGLITADTLAEKGCEVVVLNRRKSFAEEMSSNDRYYLRERLKKNGVKLYKRVCVHGFSRDGVSFSSQGETHELTGFDTVVISEKHQPVREAKALEKGAGVRFHVIGDAKDPRHLMYCIAEGEETGRAEW